jgi:hypothetical protein
MTSSGSVPSIILGGGSAGNSAGSANPGLLEQIYENLLSGAADIVSGVGIKTLVLDSGAIGTAGSIQIGNSETAAEVADNRAILAKIAAFCKANGIAIQVDADLTLPYVYGDGTNALVDQWATVAAQVGLPIVSVEDVEEIGSPQSSASIATTASIEVNAIRTLIQDYTGSSYTLNAGNLAVGDMEGGGASSMAAISAWWSAYDTAAAAAGLPGFSYVTADTGWFAPWIDQLSVPTWQGFLEALSTLAASDSMALNVVVQGAMTDTSAAQFIQQAEQNGVALALLQAAGSVDVSNILLRSWDVLPIGVGEVSTPDSTVNAAAELQAVDPLYLKGSITAQGSVTFQAPAQVVLNTGTVKAIGPLSIQWNAADLQAGSRLGVVLIDQSGTLTATQSGAGTVSNLASNILVLSGDATDLAAELRSVGLYEANAGADTVDIETFGVQGQLSDTRISVFAAGGPNTGTVAATSAQQGWLASSAVLNTGTVVTGASIITSETLYWSTNGTLNGAGGPGQSAFVKVDAIHEPLAEYGVELAPAALLGTSKSAVADVYDPTADNGAVNSGGYANNWGDVVTAGPLAGWLTNAFNADAELTSLIVQSTTNTFNPLSGRLETTVDSLAPNTQTIVVNGSTVADSFATAFTNGGSQVTQFNTGDNPAWQAGWGSQFASVTLTYDSAGRLVEEFFQGGASNPQFTVDDVFDPSNGQLWEQFQSASAPPEAAGMATYATTGNPYVPGFVSGPLYETQFNTGDNPNWNYNLGTAIASDTEVWTDYLLIANVASLAVSVPAGMSAYPYQFVNGNILDLLNLPGTINVDLSHPGTVTIDSQTMSSGLAGLNEIDAAGASGTVTLTGLAAGGTTLIGGDNVTTINGYGNDTIIAGHGLTTVTTGSGGSSVLASASGSTVRIYGSNDTITAAANCAIAATGSADVVTFASGGTFNLGSATSSATVNGNGVTVWMFGTGGAVTATGNNDQVTGGIGAVIKLAGNSDTAGASTGSTVTLSGRNEVVYANGAAIAETAAGTSAIVFGGNDTIAAAAGCLITATGAADVLNFSNGGTFVLGSAASSAIVNGNHVTVWMSGSGGIVTATGSYDQVTGGTGAMINLTGNNDTAGAGQGSTVTVSGGNDVVYGAGAAVSVTAGSVIVFGNGNTVAASANTSVSINGTNDSVGLYGTGIALSVSGHSTVSVRGSAANVQADLGSLKALAASGALGTVSFTDGGIPTLTLSASQIIADAAVLARIGSPYALTITGSSAVLPTAAVTAFQLLGPGNPRITLTDTTASQAWADDIVTLNASGQIVSQHYDWRAGQPFVTTDLSYTNGQLFQMWQDPAGGGYVMTQYDVAGTNQWSSFVQTVNAGNQLVSIDYTMRAGSPYAQVLRQFTAAAMASETDTGWNGAWQTAYYDTTGSQSWSQHTQVFNTHGQMVSDTYQWRAGQPYTVTSLNYSNGQLYQVWNDFQGGGYSLTQYDTTGVQPVAYFVQTVSAQNTMEHLQQVFRAGNPISEVDAYYDVTNSANYEVFTYAGASVGVQVVAGGKVVASDTVPASAVSAQSPGGPMQFLYGSAANPNLQATSLSDAFIIAAPAAGTTSVIAISGFNIMADIIELPYAKFGGAAQIASETHAGPAGAVVTSLDGSCQILLSGVNANTLKASDFMAI